MNNLDMICRRYAYVAISGSTPYDSKLEELNSMLTNKTCNLDAHYDEESRYAAEIKKILTVGDAPAWEKMIKTAKAKRYRIKKLGNALVEKKDNITELSSRIDKAYNKEAALVYDCSIITTEVSKIIDAYKNQLRVIEPKITGLYDLHKDKKILEDHLNKIIDDKEEREEADLTETERTKLIKYLETKGQEELKTLCTQYMQIKNDLSIAKNLVGTYEPVIGKYNEIAESFAELRETVTKQLTQIGLAIHTYETITRNELNFLEDLEMPGNFVSAVNELASGVEYIDKEFAQRLLNIFVGNNKDKIKDINLDNIVHGLIKTVRSDKNEK